MDPALVALLAAALGAGGAVAAQVIGGYFTARHETKRLAWEQQRAAEQDQQAQAKRFFDVKREKYATFLLVVRDTLAALNQRDHGPEANNRCR